MFASQFAPALDECSHDVQVISARGEVRARYLDGRVIALGSAAFSTCNLAAIETGASGRVVIVLGTSRRRIRLSGNATFDVPQATAAKTAETTRPDP